MSSLLKKKGAASFKPRAPARRPGPTAPPSASPTVPGVERQSQNPAPLSTHNAALLSTDVQSAVGPEIQSTSLLEQSADPTNPTRQDSVAISQPSKSPAQPQLPTAPLENATAVLKPSDTRRSRGQVSIPQTQEAVSTSEPTSSLPPATSTELPPITVSSKEQSLVEGTERNASASAQKSTIQDTDATLVAAPQSSRPHIDIENSERNDTVSAHTQNDPVDLSALRPGEVGRPSQLIPAVPLDLNEISSTTVPPQTSKAGPKAKKRKLVDSSIDIQPSIETQASKTRVSRSSTTPRKPRKPRATDPNAAKARKRRAETPEDAEEQEIDHSKIKMAELCKDLKIGRKFSKHDEIKQRDMDKKAKAKLRRENPDLIGASDDERPTTTRSETETPIQNTSVGPRMRLVDGQIVIDESSLNLDRHKIAAANAGVMEIIEENEFTRITTSGTFMKREKNIFWDLEAEQKFYIGLRMFGTDFEMISKMFPDRNRRQIKLKFNKEEKLYPSKINSALLGDRVPINFEEYKSHTGLEYEDVAVINAEREEIEAEQNAEEARAEAELAEATRQKKAAIHASRGPEGKENDAFGGGGGHASKKQKKGKNKNKASVFGGGEEVEIIGDI